MYAHVLGTTSARSNYCHDKWMDAASALHVIDENICPTYMYLRLRDYICLYRSITTASAHSCRRHDFCTLVLSVRHMFVHDDDMISACSLRMSSTRHLHVHAMNTESICPCCLCDILMSSTRHPHVDAISAELICPCHLCDILIPSTRHLHVDAISVRSTYRWLTSLFVHNSAHQPAHQLIDSKGFFTSTV